MNWFWTLLPKRVSSRNHQDKVSSRLTRTIRLCAAPVEGLLSRCHLLSHLQSNPRIRRRKPLPGLSLIYWLRLGAGSFFSFSKRPTWRHNTVQPDATKSNETSCSHYRIFWYPLFFLLMPCHPAMHPSCAGVGGKLKIKGPTHQSKSV